MSEGREKFKAVKGMADIMPPETALWQDVEAAVRRVFGAYGYHEVRTPVVEELALFKRGVGETTAVVEKEMYSWEDQPGSFLALRPEATASVVRAYIESGACVSEPLARYYYIGPMFRRERPQKGRQRQFYQIGCEILGALSPLADAETVAMLAHFFSELGLNDVNCELNSIGCNGCRPAYLAALKSFLTKHIASLCDDCRRRMEKNPMRVLDCKSESCAHVVRTAPVASAHLCDACKAHFKAVLSALDSMKIRYEVNERIVRGLDYYMRTAFEFTSMGLGSQNAVAGGGRYDGLVRALGGPDIAGVGVAIGVERLIMLLGACERKVKKEDLIFFAVLGDKAKEQALPIIQLLRKDGVRVEWDYGEHSLKSQMRRADKLGAESVIIIGDDEVAKGVALVRNMKTKEQREVRIKDLPMHFVEVGG